MQLVEDVNYGRQIQRTAERRKLMNDWFFVLAIIIASLIALIENQSQTEYQLGIVFIALMWILNYLGRIYKCLKKIRDEYKYNRNKIS